MSYIVHKNWKFSNCRNYLVKTVLLLCTVHVRTGGIKETDYEVLLSERAAKEIYLKWVDTLKVRSVL